MNVDVSILEGRFGNNEYCHCDPPCQRFVKLDNNIDAIVICEKFARKMMVDLPLTLGVHKEYGWTTAQENYLKERVEQGIKHGDYTIIGKVLGKSRGQVKSKVQHMRKEGKL